jgi:hypothetical protein
MPFKIWSAAEGDMAQGMSYSTASRSSDFTSTSCGRLDIGSVKNISPSSRPSAIIAPSCASPPQGPLFIRVTVWPKACKTSPPVVPVANSSNPVSAALCNQSQFQLCHPCTALIDTSGSPCPIKQSIASRPSSSLALAPRAHPAVATVMRSEMRSIKGRSRSVKVTTQAWR